MRTPRLAWVIGLAASVVVVAVSLGPVARPAPSGPARSGCVACHTDRAMLEPLVKPFPALPAEGEG